MSFLANPGIVIRAPQMDLVGSTWTMMAAPEILSRRHGCRESSVRAYQLDDDRRVEEAEGEKGEGRECAECVYCGEQEERGFARGRASQVL